MAAANEAAGSLLRLQPDARAEDIEGVLGDVQRTLSRLDSKRVTLQDGIAAASRGKRRPPRWALPLPLPPPIGVPVPVADDTSPARKGSASALRRKLRAAAGDVKNERKRLEALGSSLEEALVDAREKLALHPVLP